MCLVLGDFLNNPRICKAHKLYVCSQCFIDFIELGDSVIGGFPKLGTFDFSGQIIFCCVRLSSALQDVASLVSTHQMQHFLSCDNQKRFQTLPIYPQGKQLLLVDNHCSTVKRWQMVVSQLATRLNTHFSCHFLACSIYLSMRAVIYTQFILYDTYLFYHIYCARIKFIPLFFLIFNNHVEEHLIFQRSAPWNYSYPI